MTLRHKTLLGLFVAAAIGISPARAALEITPGLWEDTETGDINGQKQPPKVTTDCIKPEESKDIVKKARAELQKSIKESGEMAKACSKLDIQENGNVITFDMKCASKEMGGSMDVSMVVTIHSATSMTSVGKTLFNIAGQKMSSNLTTTSKYIGPCRK